jgi:hypothetical protein
MAGEDIIGCLKNRLAWHAAHPDAHEAATPGPGRPSVRGECGDHAGVGRSECRRCDLVRLGQFSRIIETAVIAITREGQRIITRRDLSDAVDDWAVANRRIGYNPFSKNGDDESADQDIPGFASSKAVDDEGEH